jgi:hypothetical protein
LDDIRNGKWDFKIERNKTSGIRPLILIYERGLRVFGNRGTEGNIWIQKKGTNWRLAITA